MAAHADEEAASGLLHRYSKQFENAAGLFCTLLVHVFLFFILFLSFNMPERPPQPESATDTAPLVMVQIGSFGAAVSNPAAIHPPRTPRAHRTRVAGQRPTPTPSLHRPKDDLAAKLRALAGLRAPRTESHTAALTQSAGVSGSGDGSGAYGVRDLIRAQVLRHWSVDFAMLRGRDDTIQIRVVLTRAGRVLSAQIINSVTGDAVIRELAMSARNAVLLSSPFVMPSGPHPARMEFVLTLNPKDAVQ
jgi:outer membrane biosynthesis protein TonB